MGSRGKGLFSGKYKKCGYNVDITKIKDSNRLAFDEMAASYDSGREWNHQHREQEFLREMKSFGVKFSPETSILDLGTGTGFYTQIFLQQGCRNIIAVDFSDRMIANLVRKLSSDAQFVKGVVSDLSDFIQHSKDTFDFACLGSVLQYIPNYLEVINGLTDLMKPGGIVYIYAPTQYKHRLLSLYDKLMADLDYKLYQILSNHRHVMKKAPLTPNELEEDKIVNLLQQKSFSTIIQFKSILHTGLFNHIHRFVGLGGNCFMVMAKAKSCDSE